MEVVVFDATNTTRQRRELLRRRVVDEKGFKLFFVESVCDDERIIENNIRSVKVKRTKKKHLKLVLKQNSASDKDKCFSTNYASPKVSLRSNSFHQ